MLNNLGGWEILVLILLGIFIFGPDKLPTLIADGVKMLRRLRDLARGATGELSRELGTDIQLEDLNPKAFIRKHVFSEEDEQAFRRPFNDLVGGVRNELAATKSELDRVAGGVRGQVNGVKADIKDSARLRQTAKPVAAAAAESKMLPLADRYEDAT
jgi:sec-independent protein translocase protein TatB